MAALRAGPNADLEKAPAGEAVQIAETTETMGQLLNRRYAGKRVLRGVHPKDHGCVEATFAVSDSLPPEYQLGVFKNPGEIFRAAIRFSNAAPLVLPDCLPEAGPGGTQVRTHGSRGMAVKLYNVSGARLVPEDHERSQDFLMINQPFFAFSNAEDYAALNKIILEDQEKPDRFFQRIASPIAEVARRAKRTLGIFQSIKTGSSTAPFQAPPLSPFDNIYFGAAPFSFGEGKVMRFAAKPVNPMTGDLGAAVNDANYLRDAMRKRMAEAGDKMICFDFQVQVRSAGQIKIEQDVEDACVAWPDPFVTVARINIPPQEIATPERQEFCETLFYTPWHGLVDHRPLGGINRLRRTVYEESSKLRGCPVSPDLPPPSRGRANARAGEQPQGATLRPMRR
jgi:hypothetical protein